MHFSKVTIAAALALGTFVLPATAWAGYEGAIAFSQSTGASGWSRNYESKRGASNAALDNCNADDCQVVYTFTNSCAALAVGDGNGYGTNWAVKKRRAERGALNACENYTSSCRVLVSVCSQ